MHEIGVGLIGYGLGGKYFHASLISRIAPFRLRAVWSRDPAKVHADYPHVEVMDDVERLVALPQIDLVVVASPDAWHAQHAMMALRAGKHVVVDKPFATDLKEAQTIAAAARKSDRVFAVYHNRRWDADFLTLSNLVQSGRLGRVVQFESRMDRWEPEVSADWKDARPGGSWYDIGAHLVDQTIQLFGKPLAVTAELATLRDGGESPDWFQVVLQYEAMRASLHASKLSADGRLRYAVHGTGGSWVKLGRDRQGADSMAGMTPDSPAWGADPDLGLFTPVDPNAAAESLPNCSGNYPMFWHRIAEAILGNGASPVPADEALTVMAVLEAGIESARSGRRIALS